MHADYNPDKFAELMLYLAELSSGDQQYGRVKLAKQLFYCDFRAYERFGRSITGATYRKLDMGPVAIPFFDTITQLVDSGRAIERRTRLAGYDRERQVLAHVDLADLTKFDQAEVDLAHSIVNLLAPYNGKGASDLSHEFVGWRLARPGEEIPYYSVFIDESASEVRPIDIERARKYAAV